MKSYQLSRLKHECIFGTTKSYENGAGVNVPYFVPQLTKMYGNVSNSIQQSYLVTGLKIEYSNNIVVRHDKQLEQMTVVKINEFVYDIKKYEPDDRINAFDVITIGKVNKGIQIGEPTTTTEAPTSTTTTTTAKPSDITIDPDTEPIPVSSSVSTSTFIQVYLAGEKASQSVIDWKVSGPFECEGSGSKLKLTGQRDTGTGTLTIFSIANPNDSRIFTVKIS